MENQEEPVPGPSILIVDDDREIARAIGLRLGKAGFATRCAFNGLEGFTMAQSERPDAIVMDLRMPVMDGFAMLERLHNSVLTRNIPAIILSADAADRARLKALRAGATGFVEKPYNPQDLIAALNAALAPPPALAKTSPSIVQENKPMTVAATQAAPNRRVLIADDDPAVVRALSHRCRKLGLDVDTAENGLQAILKAQRNPPRLMILDINMPEADGFRVCEWLLDPQRPPIDVVMLTGRDDSDTLMRCDAFGAFHVAKNQDTWGSIKAILGEILEIGDEKLAAAAPPRAFGDDASMVRERRNRILVVEDDVDLARALERRLTKCGAEVTLATNGVEAYRIAVRDRPDAVICDYVMPEGGGHYLLWRLKSTEQTRHIPVIMITGQSFDPGTEHQTERDSVGRGGAVKFFRKPVDTNALFRELQQHCTLNYTPH